MKDYGFTVDKENEQLAQSLKPELEQEMEEFLLEFSKEVQLTSSQKDFLSF